MVRTLVLEGRRVSLVPTVVHGRLALQMAAGALPDHIWLLGFTISLTEVKRVRLRVSRGLRVALLHRAAGLRILRHVDGVLFATRWLHRLGSLRASVRQLILELNLLVQLFGAHLAGLCMMVSFHATLG